MLVRRVGDVPRNERGNGQISHLLLGLPSDDTPMSITVVTAAPGSRQSDHVHPVSTQIYVIIAGKGQMTVGDETMEVATGEMVYVPPGASHAIFNGGEMTLSYVSVTVPPFPVRVEGDHFRSAT